MWELTQVESEVDFTVIEARPRIREGVLLMGAPTTHFGEQQRIPGHMTAADLAGHLVALGVVPERPVVRALVTGVATALFLQGVRTGGRLLDRIWDAHQLVVELASEAHGVGTPFEPSLMLQQRLQQARPVEVSSSASLAPYDAPVNPWVLWQAGEYEAARTSLQVALDWPNTTTEQVDTILNHWNH